MSKEAVLERHLSIAEAGLCLLFESVASRRCEKQALANALNAHTRSLCGVAETLSNPTQPNLSLVHVGPSHLI